MSQFLLFLPVRDWMVGSEYGNTLTNPSRSHPQWSASGRVPHVFVAMTAPTGGDRVALARGWALAGRINSLRW
jgi:hypothetical protein